MAKLWQLLEGHSKPPFSEKVQRGDQGKFFKNRLKSKPCLRGRKAVLRKWYCIKGQSPEKILAQTAARKVPEWPSYNNFRKVTQNPRFLKKCKGVPRVFFQKSPKK